MFKNQNIKYYLSHSDNIKLDDAVIARVQKEHCLTIEEKKEIINSIREHKVKDYSFHTENLQGEATIFEIRRLV